MATQRAGTVKKVADLMRDIDFCMFTTHADGGELRSRPMSNNGEVEFDGDVWFFSAADSRKIEDIKTDSEVQLSYADIENFVFISMGGKASIVRDVEKKRQLWMKDLERWFEEGPESDDVVLIKVTPRKVAYWGEDEGEIEL